LKTSSFFRPTTPHVDVLAVSHDFPRTVCKTSLVFVPPQVLKFFHPMAFFHCPTSPLPPWVRHYPCQIGFPNWVLLKWVCSPPVCSSVPFLPAPLPMGNARALSHSSRILLLGPLSGGAPMNVTPPKASCVPSPTPHSPTLLPVTRITSRRPPLYQPSYLADSSKLTCWRRRGSQSSLRSSRLPHTPPSQYPSPRLVFPRTNTWLTRNGGKSCRLTAVPGPAMSVPLSPGSHHFLSPSPPVRAFSCYPSLQQQVQFK